MAIPDFQTIMRPALEAHPPGQEVSRAPLRNRLSDHFELSDEERSELLPSGTSRRFNNRLAWALTYLAHAGALERPSRGVTRITHRGIDLLDSTPGKIDIGVLSQFPEFREFRKGSGSDVADAKASSDMTTTDQTPQESIETALETLRADLAQDLLDRLLTASPTFFEQVVVDTMLAMGYGGSRRDAGQRLGATGDQGLDGVIREDTLGLDAIYVQAKRWSRDNTVGRPHIQGFVGALQGVQAGKGVFITTSSFSKEAQTYAERVTPRVILIDGDELARLMIDHGVGVSVKRLLELKRVDEDYFLEGED